MLITFDLSEGVGVPHSEPKTSLSLCLDGLLEKAACVFAGDHGTIGHVEVANSSSDSWHCPTNSELPNVVAQKVLAEAAANIKDLILEGAVTSPEVHLETATHVRF